MSKPILFQPGDILTAQQINDFLVERPEQQVTALRERLQPQLAPLTDRLAVLRIKAEYKKQINQGGRPTYDYEQDF